MAFLGLPPPPQHQRNLSIERTLWLRSCLETPDKLVYVH
ncbi:hypothetical protein EKH55_0930 [Sinorhizobium alkalisoli]|nr:hypothetical protein EKH55_0930 [Sinorhizobium alkalisoli]